MFCRNRADSPHEHKGKSGAVERFYVCSEKTIGVCATEPVSMTSGGKPLTICSESCPFFVRRAVPSFWKVDIVVTSHNYGKYLAESLDSISVQDQSIVGKIIVVDDASDADDPTKDICDDRSIKYLRTEFRSPHLARGAGLKECSAPLVMFLDPDNLLPADYLISAVSQFAENPRLAIVYPDLQQFGTRTTKLTQTTKFDGQKLEQLNFIDTGSVWLTEAIKQQFIYDAEPAGLEDWRVAREVMRSGEWEAAKNPIPLDYRKHEANRLESGVYGTTYFEWAGLADETVTIFTTFSERIQKSPELWERRKEWLRQQTWPRIRLVVSNTSHQPLPAGWADDLPAMEGLAVYEHPVGLPGLEDRSRWGNNKVEREVSTAVAAIYNRMWKETSTEYVLVLEDDVFPHRPDAIEQLMRTVDRTVCAVSGKYRQRYYPYAVTYWKADTPRLPHQAPDTGFEDIRGTGFGCVLLRRSQVANEVITANSATSQYYDADLFARLAAKGLAARINFAVDCDHVGPKMPAPTMPVDKLTVVMTTTCRETFPRAFRSVVAQLAEHDDLLLVVDGKASAAVKTAWVQASVKGRLIELEQGPHGDWGHTPRNIVLPTVTSGYVVHFDDDDTMARDAMKHVRQAIARHNGDLFLLQMRREDGTIIPVGHELRRGNVGTPMFVHPAGIDLGKFSTGVYAGDFDFISQTVELNPQRELRWIDHVICNIRHVESEPESPWPIGDHIATALKTVGITKERVSAWLGRPCNCPERQKKLNDIGAWAAGFAKGLVGRAEVEQIVT